MWILGYELFIPMVHDDLGFYDARIAVFEYMKDPNFSYTERSRTQSIGHVFTNVVLFGCKSHGRNYTLLVEHVNEINSISQDLHHLGTPRWL